MLEPYGVDGDWGAKTSAALLQVRHDVGSGVSSADSMTGECYAQLLVAMSRDQARRFGGGSSSGVLPDTVRVSGELEVQS